MSHFVLPWADEILSLLDGSPTLLNNRRLRLGHPVLDCCLARGRDTVDPVYVEVAVRVIGELILI